MSFPNISERVFHTPLLAAPEKAASFVLGLGPRLLGADTVTIEGADAGVPTPSTPHKFASILDNRLSDEIRLGKRDGYAVRDGVALIPITKTLIHRGAWVGSFSGETSYEGIAAQVKAAAEDRRVRKIALEVDSYGGEVAGCFSLANLIRQVREEKEVRAFVADHSFSAAYALASQADRIIMPQAAGAGSIGVICMHADYSGQLEAMGVNVTVIAAGDHKGEGNPYEPLPEGVRDALQQEMEKLRSIFAETVGAGRGDALTAAAALATEAGCFLGQEAVDAGLADEVADPAEAFAEYVKETNGHSYSTGPTAKKETPTMSKTTTDPKNNPAGASTETTEDVETNDTAPAGSEPEGTTTAETPSATETGSAAGDERKRISDILGSEEAKGRRELAESFAFNSDMSAEEARKHLANAPKEKASKTLSETMSAEDTDLDAPSAEEPKENPVKARHKRRYG